MSPRRVALLFFAGTVLIQAAWILAIPPYRGSDEFDHVYRAASVARGHWAPPYTATPDGRGGLIPAPRLLVEDAREVCETYAYTGPANCSPVEKLPDGLVSVASAASLYSPAYYWAIGTPARLADGARAVYVMRAVSSIVCAALVGIAAWIIASIARTKWPLVGLVVALTPVTLYSLMLPAPNGVEMAAALCVWASVIGLARGGADRSTHAFLVILVVSACIVVNVRTLGPLWLAMIAVTCGVAYGTTKIRRSLAAHPGTMTVGGLALFATLVASGWWIVENRQLDSVEQINDGSVSPWLPSLGEVPLWFFQSFAAFPLRDDPAPMPVYAIGLVVFAALFGSAVLSGRPRLRLAVIAAAAGAIAVPFAITVATVATAGTFWQGRYTLPFSFGVILLCGLALDESAPRHRLVPPLVQAGAVLVTIAHVVSVATVHVKELETSPLAGDDRWVTAPTWIVSCLVVIGVAAWAWAAARPTTPGRPSGGVPAPAIPVEQDRS